MTTISLCMIVKDEQENLPKVLESAKDFVDEIIIIDTGSSDDTIKVARKFTDKVYSFKWQDDFSVARNTSLLSAKSDWILVLDADEVISKDQFTKIKELVDKHQEEIVGFRLIQRTFTNNTKQRGFIAARVTSFKGFFDCSIVRLFPNSERIRFSGEVHEKVDESIKSLGGRIIDTGIIIEHSCESLSESKKDQKLHNYLVLAQRKVKSHPKSSLAHQELGILYKQKGKFEEAKTSFLQSVLLDKENITSLKELAIVKSKLKDWQGALKINENIISQGNANYETFFGAGLCNLHLNNLEKAEEFFDKSLRENNKFVKSYLNLAIVLERQSKLQQAKMVLAQALRVNPNNADTFHNLGVLQEKLRRYDLAFNCYKMAIKLNVKNKEQLIDHVREMEKKIRKK